MAMSKNEIERVNIKNRKDDADDIFDDDSDSEEGENIEDMEVKGSVNKDMAARKRLEEYLEEKRLRKELGDDLFDF